MIALCLRHIDYQSLGTFEEPLLRRGFDIRYMDVEDNKMCREQIVSATVVVVLGGPFDVDDARNLALQDEISAIRIRLIGHNRPTIGVCLGSQVIATALGGSVRRMPHAEIGWAPIQLTDEGRESPLRHLEGLDLLHWHGCESSVPTGGRRLAATNACANQAFQVDRNILGLQFHAEVSPDDSLQAWISGHYDMLKTAGLSAEDVMAQTIRSAGAPRDGVSRMFGDWLQQIAT